MSALDIAMHGEQIAAHSGRLAAPAAPAIVTLSLLEDWYPV
jgi:hypothetical protein